MLKSLRCALLIAMCTGSACAQQLFLVMPNGPGRITISLDKDWQPHTVEIYDHGTRPVLDFLNKRNDLDVSYILFPNDTGAPTSESCRDAVTGAILRNLKKSATIENETSSTRTLPGGQKLATLSYFVAQLEGHPVRQQELLGFYGDASTCAEIHISKALSTDKDKPLLDAALDTFAYEPTVQPAAPEYGSLTMLFIKLKRPAEAALYYEPMWAATEKDTANKSTYVLFARLLTDQLSISYGMAGDLKSSRAVNEAAIARDPDYPMYYYDLACADAESGDAAAARTHLQAAYDRRANVLPGEPMPDASRDDSILKLQHDADFWKFVKSLPKS